jgi:hypothetical protein
MVLDRDKIDSGYQFKVYDKGEHVEKRRRSKIGVFPSIVGFNPFIILKPVELRRKFNSIIEKREKGIKKVEKGFFPEKLIPESYIKDEVLTQEKVRMVQEEIEESGEERSRELIDEFVEFTKECWKHGFCESSFNFTVNHGLRGGEMVLVDIGEVHYSKDEIKTDIKNKKWLGQWIYQERLPDGLKGYFKEKMNEEITVDDLEKNWKKAV